MNRNLVGAAQMRHIADLVKKQIPKDTGFAILVFPFHEPGIANYISNAERESMIIALRGKADALESRRDFPTPEEN